MALTSFPDGSYLELIAIQSNADPSAVAAHYWSKHMQNNAGPAAWAVRPKDFGSEVRRLQAKGLAIQPARSGRTRPDGVRLDWEAAPVGAGPNGVFFPFLIRDFTPREQRAYPSGKPTTQDYAGIGQVVIAVRDLQASVKRYRETYDLPEPVQRDDAKFGGRLASFAGTPVVLATPLNARSWLAARLDKIGEGPCAFILRSRDARSSISWFDTQKLGWWLGFE
jgi:hypothetical protein